MPPQWARSICTTSDGAEGGQAVEVGQGVEPLARRDRAAGPDRFTSASRSRHSGATGSSHQAGSEPLQPADHRRRRPPAESRPWNSIISPTPGPTASRTAATTVDGRLGLLGDQVLPGGAERVELQAAIAAADGRRGPLGVLGRRAAPRRTSRWRRPGSRRGSGPPSSR